MLNSLDILFYSTYLLRVILRFYFGIAAVLLDALAPLDALPLLMLLDELSFLATIDVKRELYLLETVVLIVDF